MFRPLTVLTFGRKPEFRPRYESRPYKQHPGRREHIYGRVHPMDCKCGGCR